MNQKPPKTPAKPADKLPSPAPAPAAPSRKKWVVIAIAVWAVAWPLATFALPTWMSFRQAVAAENTDNRSAGKTEAELTILRMFPHQTELPATVRVKNRVVGHLKIGDAVYFTDLDNLLWTNPSIYFKNTGGEPIDTVRVETRFTQGMIDAIDLPEEVQRRKTPWVMKQAEVEEYHLGEKMKHGQLGSVSMVRGLVAQLVQAQATDERAERDHFGMFEVTVSARHVGATAFDVAVGENPLKIKFIWLPKGFSETRCKKLLADMQPYVSIYDREE
jgi:hypothetical protein